MKYFKQNNTVYAFDEQQLSQGYGKDMTPMTDEEVELHVNPPKTEAQILAEAKSAAQSYLDSTDWIKSKFVELVMIKKTITEEEFNLKYEVELQKMDEARAILDGVA